MNNGGPAFPKMGQMGIPEQEGMTLRDYFAAKAMSKFASSDSDTHNQAVAEAAYKLADAMIAERSKTPGGEK